MVLILGDALLSLKDALHYENKINHSKTHEYIYSALPGQKNLDKTMKKQNKKQNILRAQPTISAVSIY